MWDGQLIMRKGLFWLKVLGPPAHGPVSLGFVSAHLNGNTSWSQVAYLTPRNEREEKARVWQLPSESDPGRLKDISLNLTA